MCREGKFVGTCALIVSDCSANGIFPEVSEVFEEEVIPWQNLVGLSLDNASGRHNGLYRKFKAKNECLHLWLSLLFYTQHSQSCIKSIC